MKMRPSNSSTPKSDRKQAVANDLNNSFALDSSDLDLSNYGNENRQELNSSDITVHQSNENNVNDVQNDESARRAASLGDLSLVKKSLTENDGSASMERAQSLDIHENSMPKQSLALGLSKPTADLTVINGNDTENGYEIDTNIPDDLKVIRYPKSDVLKTILSGASNALKSEAMEVEKTAPSIVVMTNGSATDENVPMTTNKSVVTIENNGVKMNGDMEALSLDVMDQQPVSLTLINNTVINDDPNQISPVFSSDNFGVNSIKISSTMMDVVAPAKTIIKNGKSIKKSRNIKVL